MATGNSKFPGLDQKYVMEIEQRTANAPTGVKEMLEQQMYSDFYAQQTREKEQAERLVMKNELVQKELDAKGNQGAGPKLEIKKGNLADAIRNFYKLTVSDGDDESLIDKFTNGIKNGTKMYVDYLNGDNNDIMVKTGLFGDKWKQLNEAQKIKANSNVSNAVTDSLNKQTQNKTSLSSTSHFDDDNYASYYLEKAPEEYKPFIQEAQKQGYPNWEIASLVDAKKTYDDFNNRGIGSKGEEINVGVWQGFLNFFGNAYNNLAGENPYVGIAPKLDMNKIQFKDDLLGAGNNYGNLRATSAYTEGGEIGGDLLANTAVMMLLPGFGAETRMESLAESALNNGTKGVLKNIGQRGIYGATEGAEFGALATLGQEDANLDKLSGNMTAGAGLGSVFGFLGAGGNAYKYKNILKNLAKEGDKEGTIKGLLDMYNRGVKPTSQGVKTNTQLQQYNDDAMGAVESIIKNKDALKYVDANGEETFGHLPRTLDEFSQAIKQTKQSIYDRYAAIAREAGVSTSVDTSEITKELNKLLKNKEWRAGQNEATISKIEKWIKDLEGLNNTMTVEGTQTKIQELNQKLQAFLKSQNPNDVGANAVDGLVLNGLKKGVDDAIDRAGLDSEEYIQLRDMYRQLKSIESDVNHRAVVYGRQNPQSLIDSMSDLQTIDAIADIFSNPIGGTVKLVKTKAFKTLAKDRNNSNKIVENMFKDADDTISKTDTLKTQAQIANERTQRQQYNIRKSRQQRLEEANYRRGEIEKAKQEIAEKQAQQEQEYQNYLNLMEKLKKPENPGLGYNEGFNGEPTTTIKVTPEGTSIRQGQIAETPTKNINYSKPSENNPIVNEKTGETLEEAVEKLKAQGWAEETINNFKEAVLKKAKGEEYKLGKKTLDELIEPVDTKVTEVYHGTRSDVADNILKEGYKSSSELPEGAYKGGGYDKTQEVISFATDRNSADTFAKASGKGEVLKTEIKDGANVVKIKGDYDAEDLAEYLPELREKGIDAVILDNGENEFVVINRDIIGKSEKTTKVSKPKAEEKTTVLDKEDYKEIKKYKDNLKELYDEAGDDDYVYFVHNTADKNVDAIKNEGLRSYASRGSNLHGHDSPSAIWGTLAKDHVGFGGNQIYFRVPKSEAKKLMVNDTEMMIYRDVKPEDIVAINRATSPDVAGLLGQNNRADLYDYFQWGIDNIGYDAAKKKMVDEYGLKKEWEMFEKVFGKDKK